MKIICKVKVSSKESKAEILADGSLKVTLVSPPKENKANKELIKVLSAYFNIPQMCIKIKMGKTSKNKVVEIDNL